MNYRTNKRTFQRPASSPHFRVASSASGVWALASPRDSLSARTSTCNPRADCASRPAGRSAAAVVARRTRSCCGEMQQSLLVAPAAANISASLGVLRLAASYRHRDMAGKALRSRYVADGEKCDASCKPILRAVINASMKEAEGAGGLAARGGGGEQQDGEQDEPHLNYSVVGCDELLRGVLNRLGSLLILFYI